MSARILKHAPRLRAPRDLTGVRTPTTAELDWAIGIVDSLGEAFHEALVAKIRENRGRHASVRARNVLIGWLLTTYEPAATAAHTRVAENLLALSAEQRERIGLPAIPANRAYARVWDKTNEIIKALDEGFTIGSGALVAPVDLDWFVDALARCAIPVHLPTSRTRAVDGTDWETCGTFVSSNRQYEGYVPTDTDGDVDDHLKEISKVRKELRKGKLVSFGADDRPIYTRDCDARAGHRSANNRHSSGLYIGYELHLSVQIPDASYGGKPDQVVLGQEVPGFITMARLTPAGAHRLDAVVPGLIAEQVPSPGTPWTPGASGTSLETVVWDRGYSILDYTRGKGALRAAGVGIVFDLATRQRTLQAIYPSIDFIDGVPFSKHMPQELRDLPRPERDDTPEERAAKTAAFDRRAIWRFTPHGTARDGARRRWICPFCAGRLAIADRVARKANVTIAVNATLVELPEGETCCDGIVTLPDDAVHMEQAFGMLWGTTAHTVVYGQRALVENANNLLHDKYARLDRGYTKLMGLAKRKFVLAFLLAGVNRKIAQAWEAKESAREEWQRKTTAYEAQLRGEPAAAPPSADVLRQRRYREAKRARKATAAPTAPTGRSRTAARVAASRQ
ncbi:hypothetical protein Cch01nite_24820 [Cellulomonas chitinilytica]|uniref:Uncharacterized protein n=1 Tax=Cellulomonas chitinilytica TaxID=398759 RepID=A0A919U0B3_9CELL|nr:hypothetical protein [Cellulomonas chitinilytica]GIG21758.1 hypothetical protein Cch01nite_24820 [Cellulomonas chitinilytica]